jgi:predicted DNA-binding transcriptional regulator YafY
MAQNKNALIRYKTIDKCLQNKYRKWTLQDLVDACSDALYEYEGRDVNVSLRTTQLDIQMMRSDKLGYNAPIEVYDKRFYRYADEDYSITNIPLTENDMTILIESVEMLKQFKNFSLFHDLNGVIQRLEDTIYVEKTHQSPIIHLDKNEQLKGLEHFDPIYQAIIKKICLVLYYRSFKAREAVEYQFHPYILKQFNNRWFVVGREEGKTQIMTFALDRIERIDYNLDLNYSNDNFDGDLFYQNTYGVTVLGDAMLMDVTLKIDRENAPYVLTKPFHHSQILLETCEDGAVIIRLRLHLNMEFDRLLLGFGPSIEVLKPKILRNRICRKLKMAYEQYTGERPQINL